MNVREARELTKKYKQKMVEPTLTLVYSRIEERAKQGLNRLDNPFQGHTAPNHVIEAVLNKLRKDGFQIKRSGDGRNGAQDYITWED